MFENRDCVGMFYYENISNDWLSLCNRNISGLSFGTFGNTTSKILGEVTMVTNGGAQAESGTWVIFIVKHTHTIPVLKHVFVS
jgi:hypothetical protein